MRALPLGTDCQVIIGLNKEAILSEKHLVGRFGQTVGVAYSGKSRRGANTRLRTWV